MYACYPRAYALLKRNGHSPAVAERVLLDAKRRQPHALRWLRLIRRCDQR